MNINLLKLHCLKHDTGNIEQIICDRGDYQEQNEEHHLFRDFDNETEIIFPTNLIFPHNTLIWSDNLDRERAKNTSW